MRGAAALMLATSLLARASAQTQAPAGEFFDDFKQTSLAELRASGWLLREGTGHPGAPGSRFAAGQIALDGGLLHLRLSTDGTPAGTVQPQLCQARKFLIGTTTARIRLRDTAGHADPVVQAYYLAGPLRFDHDPEFSEVDFEYLPNGGWGSPEPRLYGVSWQTVRLAPWQSYNTASQAKGSHDGWQLLTVQVEPTRARHFIGSQPLNEAHGRHVPVVPMAISFSHWLAQGAKPGPVRTHGFEVDWVLHVDGAPLSPDAMQARATALQRLGVAHKDTVPESGLTSDCNL